MFRESVHHKIIKSAAKSDTSMGFCPEEWKNCCISLAENAIYLPEGCQAG